MERLNNGAHEFPQDERSASVDLPLPPEGTQVALLRKLLHINSVGELESSSVYEQIQIYVMGKRQIVPHRKFEHVQRFFYEARISRTKAQTGNAELVGVTQDAREFRTLYQSHGFDPFESKAIGKEKVLGENVMSCRGCHQSSAKGEGFLVHGRRILSGTTDAKFQLGNSDLDVDRTIEIKKATQSWKRLQELWVSLKR